MKLKHREFVLHLLADPKRCAGRAYAKAYKKDYEKTRGSCDSSAHTLLRHPEISALIKEKEDEEEKRIADKYHVDKDKIIRKLAAIAYSNIDDFLTYDNDGVYITPSSELTRMQTAALKKVTQKATKYGDDISIELHDKRGALVDLARILGMYKNKLELDAGADLTAFFKAIDGSTRDPMNK